MKREKRAPLVSHVKTFGIIIVIAILLSFAVLLLSSRKNVARKESNTPILIHQPSATPIPMSTATILSYHDSILGISFDYPGSLGQARILGNSSLTEDWHRIDFDKGGFEAGYYELSSSTANYQPIAGEGSPHFFDEKVLASDSTDSVKSALEKAHFIPVSVEKVQNTNGIPAFRAYVTFCYGPCQLERLYIIPLNNQKYSNLLILTVMGIIYAVPTTNASLPIDQTKQLALKDGIAIENGTALEKTLLFAKGQDLIFNSLLFDK